MGNPQRYGGPYDRMIPEAPPIQEEVEEEDVGGVPGMGKRWQGFESKDAWRAAGKPWPDEFEEEDEFPTLFSRLRTMPQFNPNPGHAPNVPFSSLKTGGLSGAQPATGSSGFMSNFLLQPYDPMRGR